MFHKKSQPLSTLLVRWSLANMNFFSLSGEHEIYQKRSFSRRFICPCFYPTTQSTGQSDLYYDCIFALSGRTEILSGILKARNPSVYTRRITGGMGRSLSRESISRHLGVTSVMMTTGGYDIRSASYEVPGIQYGLRELCSRRRLARGFARPRRKPIRCQLHAHTRTDAIIRVGCLNGQIHERRLVWADS